MREHPKPSLQSLRDIVAHYEELASGDYTSLSTRYLYLMSREVIFVLDSLERGGGSTCSSTLAPLNHGTYKKPCRNEERSSSFGSTSFVDRCRQGCRSYGCHEQRCGEDASRAQNRVASPRHSRQVPSSHVSTIEEGGKSMRKANEMKLRVQAEAFRSIVQKERNRFEQVYRGMVDRYRAEIMQASELIERYRRESKAAMELVARSNSAAIRAVKEQEQKKRDKLEEDHRREEEAHRSKRLQCEEQMRRIIEAARCDEAEAIDRVRRELRREHAEDLALARRMFATEKATVSGKHEEDMAVGAGNIALLADMVRGGGGLYHHQTSSNHVEKRRT